MRLAAVQEARALIVAAVRAGRQEDAPNAALEREILDGEPVAFERLGFDSLGWMEFCISIEVNSGLELTPGLVAEMRALGEVEAWLAARVAA